MITKVFKYISDISIFTIDKYYHIEYLVLNEDESESKLVRYKAAKYKTFKEQLDKILKEYILI